MIRRLRLKFVALSMSLVSVVLLCIFLAVNYSVQRSIEAISRQVLYQVIQDEGIGYFSDAERPDIAIFRGQERVLLPYFTVNVWPQNGIAYVTGGTYSNLEDTEVLQDILSACLRQEEDEGTIASYGLRYLRQNNGAYEKIAFVDMSMEQAMLRRTLLSYLPIALGAFLLLLAASVLLSRWATVPVERAWKAQRQFLSDASHELKTPLTVILSNAELLESGMIQDDGMKLDFARRIKKEAAGMTGLINDILMISRLESMDAEVMFSDVRISVLLQEIMDSLKPLAASCQVFLHVDCKPLCIRANLQQMKELFTNLATNAIKYNRPGGQVWITVGEQGDDMLVRVKDNGVGIPKESLDRIFERFYRVDKGRSRKQGGTGLGLSIVKHIVNFYHGTIHVTSELDKGTEFTVTIPLDMHK